MGEDAREKAKVIRGTAALAVREVLGTLIGIFYHAVVWRELGVEGIAVVAMLTMLYTLFPLFSLIAIPTAIQKFIAEHLGRKDEDAVKSLIQTSFKVILASSALSLVVSLAAAPIVANTFFGGEYLSAFQLVSLAIATYVASSILGAIFFGFQLYGRYGAVAFVGSTSSQLVSLVLILLQYGPQAFVASWIIENSLAIVLLAAMRPRVKASTAKAYPIRPLVAYSFPLFCSTFISYLGSGVFITLFILSKLSSVELGIYKTALTAVAIPRVYQSTFLATFFPHLSRVYGEKGFDEVGHNVDWAVRLLSFVFSPIVVGLGLLASSLFYIQFGGEFGEAVPIFMVLLAFSLVNFILSPFTQGMQALGYTKKMLQVQLVSTAIAVASSSTLAVFGVIGVAAGAETLGLSSSLLNFYFFKKYVHPKINWSKAASSLLASLTIAPPLYLSNMVLPRYSYLPLQIAILLLQTAIGVAVYVATVRTFRLVEKKDLEVITSIFPAKVRGTVLKLFIR